MQANSASKPKYREPNYKRENNSNVFSEKKEDKDYFAVQGTATQAGAGGPVTHSMADSPQSASNSRGQSRSAGGSLSNSFTLGNTSKSNGPTTNG